MRYLLYAVVAISGLWSLFISEDSLVLSWYKLLVGAPMWGSATLSLLDFASAVMGKNSPFITRFFQSIRDDLANCAISGIVLFVFYLMLPLPYGPYNVDIALFGLPFFVCAMLRIAQCARREIAGHRLPRRISCGLLMFVTAILAISLLVAWKAALHHLSGSASLWYQISVLLSSIFLFIESNRLLFFIKEKRIEASPIMLSVLSSMRFSTGLYKAVADGTAEWNAATRKAERMARADKALQSKKKRKRKRR